MIYRFNIIHFKISAWFPVKTDKLILKFIWKFRGPKIVKTTLKKNNKFGGLMFSNFKIYCKATIIKTLWSWHKDRYVNQWNLIESPERNAHIDDQLIFNMNGKTIQWGRKSFFGKWCWDNWMSTQKRMKFILYHKSHAEGNSKSDYKTLRRKHRPNSL